MNYLSIHSLTQYHLPSSVVWCIFMFIHWIPTWFHLNCEWIWCCDINLHASWMLTLTFNYIDSYPTSHSYCSYSIFSKNTDINLQMKVQGVLKYFVSLQLIIECTWFSLLCMNWVNLIDVYYLFSLLNIESISFSIDCDEYVPLNSVIRI